MSGQAGLTPGAWCEGRDGWKKTYQAPSTSERGGGDQVAAPLQDFVRGGRSRNEKATVYSIAFKREATMPRRGRAAGFWALRITFDVSLDRQGIRSASASLSRSLQVGDSCLAD